MTYVDPFGLVGTTVAQKYAVEAVVGEGGFSVVYRATHLMWKRPVALKAFRLGDVAISEREALVQSFVREGALLAELSERSVAICQARDVATLTTPAGDWVPYLVLEWLDGEPLDAVMARERASGTRRSLAEAFALLEPAIDALAIAHEAGIAHCDVKPANLFLVSTPDAARGRGARSVKLVDFGIAKVVRGARERSIGGAAAVDTTSYTPGYAAPEQFAPRTGPVGPWTDVFALALILVELASGRDALEGAKVDELARSACAPSRPTPRARGAHVSDAVEAVFARALAVRPADRYRDARAFRDALRAALGDVRAIDAISVAPVSIAVRDPRLPGSVTRRANRARASVGGVVGAVGLLVGVAGLATGTYGPRVRHDVAGARLMPPIAAPAAAPPRVAPAPPRPELLPPPSRDPIRDAGAQLDARPAAR